MIFTQRNNEHNNNNNNNNNSHFDWTKNNLSISGESVYMEDLMDLELLVTLQNGEKKILVANRKDELINHNYTSTCTL